MTTITMDNKAQHKKQFRMIWPLLLIVLSAGAWFFTHWRSAPDTTLLASPSTSSEPSASQSTTDDISQLDAATVEEQQRQAAKAANAMVGVGEYQDEVKSRPDFVSPVEWEILKGVAQQQADSKHALVALVNHLRFAKQQESWENLLQTGANPQQRHALAQQLLQDIPARVEHHDMSRDQAHALQLSLLDDLIADPALRRERAKEEAQRIGVTFSVEKTVQP